MARHKKLIAIDLFAGIGGIRLGLEKAGFNVVFSSDIDAYCKQTFDQNHKEKLILKDIKEIDSSEIPEHDLLTGGFPCQPFSMAGHRRGFDDERGHLFFEIKRILKDKQPRAFLLENVKHLEKHNGGATFDRIKNILENELGYKVFYKILNSKNFGLAQSRPRIYIVGFKNHDIKFNFPDPLTLTPPPISTILEKGDIEDWYYLSQKYYEGLIKHKERHRKKGHGFGFNILETTDISYALVVGNMGRERNLIKDVVKPWFYKGGNQKSGIPNSDGVRRLTIKECSRLQGLPENFTFPVSKTQAYKQIGNSVAIPVVEAIAKVIKKALYLEEKTKNKDEFVKDRLQEFFIPYTPSPI
ncbi:DNA (cytosine-5-)-methyltransferase [Candidatus Roizmanbacteria bacterium CG_4_10_14_0_8_um_filter_33_9]|uniref:Cytosine-specific methyltransferase n=1 Tax=Candidatus Roizmanbacteria bacterium CG_4_10_14_0_8_um_filter_33_9 TaxID=1974826 RepID=A0A2M7QKJ8_9BACT|nr:MAG: DNA (cytosine-5-)-methyltransferase [Candidatus Roizmanbacteria bacterium CG_4_10_14_0_8_um_filter_33_9]